MKFRRKRTGLRDVVPPDGLARGKRDPAFVRETDGDHAVVLLLDHVQVGRRPRRHVPEDDDDHAGEVLEQVFVAHHRSVSFPSAEFDQYPGKNEL